MQEATNGKPLALVFIRHTKKVHRKVHRKTATQKMVAGRHKGSQHARGNHGSREAQERTASTSARRPKCTRQRELVSASIIIFFTLPGHIVASTGGATAYLAPFKRAKRQTRYPPTPTPAILGRRGCRPHRESRTNIRCRARARETEWTRASAGRGKRSKISSARTPPPKNNPLAIKAKGGGSQNVLSAP